MLYSFYLEGNNFGNWDVRGKNCPVKTEGGDSQQKKQTPVKIFAFSTSFVTRYRSLLYIGQKFFLGRFEVFGFISADKTDRSPAY